MDIDKLYDAVIIGGGPAGLTAAIYLARARYRVLVVEKDHFGGQITITDEVVNYPGVYAASGSQLTETMRRQAQAFGAEFMLAEVTGFDLDGDVKRVKTSKGDIPCFAALLATGASPRSVGFAGEDEFRGHGVAYCATCDGEFFTGKDVFVVGGGFAAAEESVFLTKYARHVTVLVREDDFTCAPAAAEEAKRNKKITVLYNTEVVEATGDSALRTLRYRNIKTGEENTGIRIVKYPLYPSGDVGLMAYNLVVLRLTEVYYTLAEVSFRLGNPAKAEAILNQIRKRYYAPEDWEQVRYPEDGSVLTAQELLDEWGREFLAEKRRRTDLNRFGLFTTGIWWDKQPSDSYRRFYPIPARAISANPLLKRSEGYIY